MFPYSLVRSKRKTLAIYITKGAAVEVRAPLKMPKADIDRFVAAKEQWIAKHLARREQRNEAKAEFRVDYGDMLLLRGKQYPLVAQEGNQAGFDGGRFYLPPALPPHGIKQVVVRTYKNLAKILLTAKAGEYAKQLGVQATAIKISNAKTRWGSCSGKNSLNFSWRLVMGSEEVIDYLVVHELAHTRHHDHSARFWALVASVLPDYKARQKELKQLQEKLATEDWD